MTNDTSGGSTYRWYILILGMLSDMLGIAIPSMCLPVLFQEIGRDLNLDLVQLGLVWSIGALPGAVTMLLGGAIGDRLGPKRVLTAACLLAGLTGALRGLSGSFLALVVTVFLFGFVTPAIPMNAFKMCSLWFPRRQLGLANGVLSMGMALGFMLGSMISATALSPLLGGWRNVLLLYGILGVCLSIPWYFTRPAPAAAIPAGTAPMSLRQTLSYVARIRKLWLLGWAILGIGGCVQAALGYLPLYLRGLGWPDASADGAASTFHLVSMICVIPIALLSDRVGSRKKILVPATLMIVAGWGLVALVSGPAVWLAVGLAGMVRDGFMAVFMILVVETDGIGPAYAGTATGFVMAFSGVGSLLAPPLGNSLAGIAPGLPFVFWATLAAVGALGIFAARERRAEPVLAAQTQPAG